MTYVSTIPLATDKFKDSQPLILGNFASIKTAIELNHGTFDAPDQGQHKFLTMPIQSPAPAAVANCMQMYTKIGTSSTVPELFLKRAGGSELNCTEASLIALGGWAYLPCGLLIQWGQNTQNIAKTKTTFPKAFTNCFMVHAQYIDPSLTPTAQSITITSINNPEFYSVGSVDAVEMKYFALGI